MSHSDSNENEALIRTAKEAVVGKARHHVIGGVNCTTGSDGQLRILRDVENLIAERMEAPPRRQGNATLCELDSFIAHVNQYKRQRCTVVYADSVAALFTAVYNDHPDGSDPAQAGWRDFRAQYACPLSPEWTAWLANANEPMSQSEFGDWLDERMDDLVLGGEGSPSPVEMLEMARNLHIYTQGTFSKVIDPTTGQYSMVCKEEHTSESTKIPRAFSCALRIFDGGAQYSVEMRVQFRMVRGAPVFSYNVHRAKELQADAFGDMRSKIHSDTDCPVLAGLPG